MNGAVSLKTSPTIFRISFFLAWLVFPAMAISQEDPATAARTNEHLALGNHVFRHMLHEMKLLPLHYLSQLQEDPQHKLLIVLGDLTVLNNVLDDFVRRGGNALIATDRFATGTDLRLFAVHFQQGPLRLPPGSPSAYRHSEECILVQGTPDGDLLFRNLSKVATNRAGHIIHGLALSRDIGRTGLRSRGLKVMGKFPDGVNAETESGNRQEGIVFAVGGRREPGEGRVLFLSDHSVFINAMLLQEDNDNYDFAQNCLNWLTDDQHKEVLLIDEGKLERTFEVPMREEAPPPVENIVQAVDRVIQGLEEEGRVQEILNDFIYGPPDNASGMRPPSESAIMIFRFGLYAATLALVVYGLARAAQARHRVESEGPALADCIQQVRPRVTLAEQRRRWLLSGGNYWEMARSLARHELETRFGPEVAAGEPRDVEIRGSWYRRLMFQRRLRKLWLLAYHDRPHKITGKQLLRTGAAIDELREELEANGERKSEL
jgi:hypothetical protein